MFDSFSQTTRNIMTDKGICRLCGRQNGIFISIFESTPDCLQKIEAVVPDVVILQYDSLSKVVCHRCVAKVKEFYDFKLICIQTQKLLQENVPWMSHIDKNTDGTQSKPTYSTPSPMVTYMSNALAFPYGDPEAEAVEVLVLSDDEDVDSGTSQQAPPSSAPVHHQLQERSSIVANKVMSSFKKASQPGESRHGNIKMSFKPKQGRRVQLGAESVFNLTDQNQHFSGVQIQPVAESSSVISPASKRPCLQPSPHYSIVNGIVKVNESARNPKLSVMPQGDLRVGATSNALPCSSVLSTSSQHSGNVDMAAEKNISLSKMPPAVPIRNVKALPETCEKLYSSCTKTAESCGNGSNHFSDGLVDGLSLLHPQIGKLSVEKPKPKSKKKKIKTELSKADCQRICQTYPTIKAVNIVHNSVTIFTCSQCNKILVTEDAIAKHDCVIAVSHEETDVSNNEDNTLTNPKCIVTEEETASACSNLEKSFPNDVKECMQSLISVQSNHSSNQPVELVVSDDESSDSSFTPKHTCTVCSKQFHSFARLEKHQVAHSQ